MNISDSMFILLWRIFLWNFCLTFDLSSKQINSYFFSENICRDFIFDVDGKLTTANRYTVLTVAEEASIYVPCTPEENKWKIIQQRVDDSVSFEQDKTAYTKGFGSPDGNYFMGLKQISELTNFPKKLQIYLESFDGDVAVLYYESFKIGKT